MLEEIKKKFDDNFGKNPRKCKEKNGIVVISNAYEKEKETKRHYTSYTKIQIDEWVMNNQEICYVIEIYQKSEKGEVQIN